MFALLWQNFALRESKNNLVINEDTQNNHNENIIVNTESFIDFYNSMKSNFVYDNFELVYSEETNDKIMISLDQELFYKTNSRYLSFDGTKESYITQLPLVYKNKTNNSFLVLEIIYSGNENRDLTYFRRPLPIDYLDDKYNTCKQVMLSYNDYLIFASIYDYDNKLSHEESNSVLNSVATFLKNYK